MAVMTIIYEKLLTGAYLLFAAGRYGIVDSNFLKGGILSTIGDK